jgi:hypothetical protein
MVQQRSRVVRLALVACLSLAFATLPAFAQEIPTEVGQCVSTNIAEITSRLEGVPDSGTAIRYDNDLWGVSYESVPEVENSEVGDPVELCLESVPENCPPGDDRGRFYSAHNERTGEGWALPDAEHMCGGA